MNDYPKRRPFYSQHVIRAMTKRAVAQEIGANACWLVSLIAATEDARRYAGPVTWFNGQLLALTGCSRWVTLDRMRQAAIDTGWLNYEAPPEGGRLPGKYWTNSPDEHLIDTETPCDESDALQRAYEAGLRHGYDLAKAGKPYPENRHTDGGVYPENGYGRGYGRGYGPSQPPILNPIPKEEGRPEQVRDASSGDEEKAEPKADPKPPKFSEADHQCAESLGAKLLELKPDFRDLQPDRRKTTLAKWAEHVRLMRERDGRTHAQIMDLFSRVQRDPFWAANCLSPATLRVKWDRLELATKKAGPAPTPQARKILAPPPSRKAVNA